MADEDLPPSYVKSCRKFLKELSYKRQATGGKQQAPEGASSKLDKTGI
jgi:hypothetical protein